MKDENGQVILDSNNVPIMHRPYELRRLNELFINVCIAQMLRRPNDETQFSIVWIPPKGLNDEWGEEWGCKDKDSFDLDKLKSGQYKGYQMGGSHKITCKGRILKMKGRSHLKCYQVELCWIYVGELTVEDAALIARMHNADGHFVHKATMYDKVNTFRAVWVQNGMQHPAPWPHFREALHAAGMQSVKDKDAPEARSNAWIWSLIQLDHDCWRVLQEWLLKWTKGEAYGQQKRKSRELKKLKEQAAKEQEQALTQAPGESPAKGKKKKTKKKATMAGGAPSTLTKDTAPEEVFIDIPGKEKWDPFAGIDKYLDDDDVVAWDNQEENVRSEKLRLFTEMLEGKLTIEDAGTRAKTYKASKEAASDFMRILGTTDQGWAKTQEEFPVILSNDAFHIVSLDYVGTAKKTVEGQIPGSKKKITDSMRSKVEQALADRNARNNPGRCRFPQPAELFNSAFPFLLPG